VSDSTYDQWLPHDNRRFLNSWNFFAAVTLKPQEVDDFLDLLEDQFEKDLDRFGESRARFL
jgi:hypothetical protein